MPIRPSRTHVLAISAATGAVALLAASAVSAAAAGKSGLDEQGGAARHSVTAGPDQVSQSELAHALNKTKARNVILLIGDGMGDSEITVARDYLYGAGGTLPGIDALPITGQYTTYSLYKDGSPLAGKPDYTPDSAATGTAWATGTKTYDNAVSVDIHGNAHATLLERAKSAGLRTGDVTTSEIQDATPAVQVAHVGARSCYGPDTASCGADALVNGGKGSISEQLLNTRPDVTLGGGAATFAQTAKAGQWNGQTLWAQASGRGYNIVTDGAGLAGLTKADQASPADGAPLRVSYGTAAAGGSQQHTGSQLRIAAYGPGAVGVLGLSDQTDTFFTIANALGLKTD